MSLTPSDLQQIGFLLDQKLAPIHKKLESHTTELLTHKKELKNHRKLLKKIKFDQDAMLDLLDREQMSQRKRLTVVEDILQIN